MTIREEKISLSQLVSTLSFLSCLEYKIKSSRSEEKCSTYKLEAAYTFNLVRRKGKVQKMLVERVKMKGILGIYKINLTRVAKISINKV